MHQPLLRRFTDMLHWKLKLAGLAVLASVFAASGGCLLGLFGSYGTFW
jgi:hypothetical protein